VRAASVTTSDAPATTTETTINVTAVTTTAYLLGQEDVIAGPDASAAPVALSDSERVNAAADHRQRRLASIAAAIAATSHYAERRPHPASLAAARAAAGIA